MTSRSDAYDVIRHDAIAGIERRRLQPDRQLAEVQAEIERAVDDYQRQARLGDEVPLGDAETMVHRVLRSITDLGPLTDLLARSDVEEIFIEGARVTYLDSSGRLRGLAEPTAEDENRQILDRLLAVTDRQLNAKHPMVQARVLDGSARLTAAIPPVADCLSATVRRYTVRDVTLDELVARDALTPSAAAFLWALVQQRSRIVISGEPGAGKTTLAAAVLGVVAGESLHPVLRGGPGARGSADARRVLRGSPGRSRRHRRDLASRSREVRAGDASRPDRRRRGARRRGVRAHARSTPVAGSCARCTPTARPTRSTRS